MRPLDPPLRIAPATASERGTVARLAFGAPSREATWLAGGAERACDLALALHQAGLLGSASDEAWIARVGEEPVGVLLARVGGGDFEPSWSALAALLRTLLRFVPLTQLPGLARRRRLRRRLDFRSGPDALHVAELHVLEAWRGRGAGAALLEAAEAEARARGLGALSLTTLSNNPARHLFERHGFRVVAERLEPRYPALVGAPGRVLMRKPLGDLSAPR